MDRPSFASITSSEGAQDLPRHVLYQPGGVDEQSDAHAQAPSRASVDDTHSELDLDLYEEETPADAGQMHLEHLSLASDDFESILGEHGPSGGLANVDADADADADATPGIPAYLHNPNLVNSFVSVGGSEALDRSVNRGVPLSAQRPPRPQVRLYDAPALSLGLPRQPPQQYGGQARQPNGAPRAMMMALPSASQDGSDSTISSVPSSQRYGRSQAFPGRPEPLIRTDFTGAAGSHSTGVGTPKDEGYDVLGTPPGDPPSSHRAPGSGHGAVPGLAATASPEAPLPRSLSARWLLALMALGFAAGSTALQYEPPAQLGFWLNEAGALYSRVLNCVTVPMAFCQVVFSVSTLTAKHTLRRLWAKTLALFLLVCVLSAWVAIGAAFLLRPWLSQQADLGLSLSYPTFAFQCADNGKLLEVDADTGGLRCAGVSAVAVTSPQFSAPANATFARIVDLDGALGLPVTVAVVDYTQYAFALTERYFPSNIVEALSGDLQLSIMVIATVLGVAVTRSFRGLQARSNPLLRLFVHLYAALFTVLEWLQTLALAACLPLTAGSTLVATESPAYMRLAGYYCLACVLVAAAECLVVCPLVFYWFTRRNPFGWLRKVAAPVLLSVMLQSPLLPLGAATRVVMRTREVPPPVFGAVFPMLAALNRIAQALGLPLGLAFVAIASGCDAFDAADARTVLMLFGFVLVACVGETALARSQLAYFLTTWHLLCGGDAHETPAAVLAISGIGLIIYRLGALANFVTNMMLVRMAASTEEGRLHAEQHLA